MKLLITSESIQKPNLFLSYWPQTLYDGGKRFASFSGAQIVLNSFATDIVVLIRQDISVF